MAIGLGPRLGVIRSGAAREYWYPESQALFRLIDALVMGAVLDKDLATPPGSPVDGALYIVAGSPTGAWTGHAKAIAYWDATAAAWFFYAPLEGFSVWVADENLRYTYDGSVWAVEVSGAPLAAADREFALELEGLGSVLSVSNPSRVPFLRVRVASHLKGWHVFCDASGTLALDIQKVSYASYPTFATLGTTNPSLSSVQKLENTSLNVALAAGDLIRVVPTGTATTITFAGIMLDVTVD